MHGRARSTPAMAYSTVLWSMEPPPLQRAPRAPGRAYPREGVPPHLILGTLTPSCFGKPLT